MLLITWLRSRIINDSCYAKRSKCLKIQTSKQCTWIVVHAKKEAINTRVLQVLYDLLMHTKPNRK